MKNIDHSSAALSLVDIPARKNYQGALYANDDTHEQKPDKRTTLMAWLEKIFSEFIWKGV